jgi:N-glycosylase/DNA lyase
MEEFSLGNAVSAAAPRSGAGRWEAFPTTVSPAVMAEILDGGQAFAWTGDGSGIWTGRWGPHAAQLRPSPDGHWAWRALTPATSRPDLLAYFGEDAAWAALTDALPWRSDPVLAEAVGAFPGLRLLRQPLGETLLAFICSSTKQIVQIKALLALLAARFGDALPGAPPRLPAWDRLATVPEADLRACKLGYRARYVAATARLLAETPDWEARLRALDDDAARAWLCRLPGVGAKVADCVLLFGAQRLGAFPIDTWILKVLARAYGLEGWAPSQLAHFARVHFGARAGLAQQYLFARIRQAGRRTAGADPPDRLRAIP